MVTFLLAPGPALIGVVVVAAVSLRLFLRPFAAAALLRARLDEIAHDLDVDLLLHRVPARDVDAERLTSYLVQLRRDPEPLLLAGAAAQAPAAPTPTRTALAARVAGSPSRVDVTLLESRQDSDLVGALPRQPSRPGSAGWGPPLPGRPDLGGPNPGGPGQPDQPDPARRPTDSSPPQLVNGPDPRIEALSAARSRMLLALRDYARRALTGRARRRVCMQLQIALDGAGPVMLPGTLPRNAHSTGRTAAPFAFPFPTASSTQHPPVVSPPHPPQAPPSWTPTHPGHSPIDRPVDLTVPPVDLTAPPVDLTAPPVDLTAPPVDLTAPPVDLTAPPLAHATSSLFGGPMHGSGPMPAGVPSIPLDLLGQAATGAQNIGPRRDLRSGSRDRRLLARRSVRIIAILIAALLVAAVLAVVAVFADVPDRLLGQLDRITGRTGTTSAAPVVPVPAGAQAPSSASSSSASGSAPEVAAVPTSATGQTTGQATGGVTVSGPFAPLSSGPASGTAKATGTAKGFAAAKASASKKATKKATKKKAKTSKTKHAALPTARSAVSSSTSRERAA